MLFLVRKNGRLVNVRASHTRYLGLRYVRFVPSPTDKELERAEQDILRFGGGATIIANGIAIYQ
jgi:hypothetical protein